MMANENETHEEVCAEMRSFGDVPPPMFAWRDLAERAEAAHKREIAAKDAEIEDLKSLDTAHRNLAIRAVKADNKKKEEIAKRDALIKELYECLHEAVIEMCHNFECCGSAPEYKCNSERDCFVKKWRKVLAKAAGEDEGK